MRWLILFVLTVAGLWFTVAALLGVIEASPATGGAVPTLATTGLLGVAMLAAAFVLFRRRSRAPDPRLAALRTSLREGMLSHLDADDDVDEDDDENEPPPYTAADVDACLAIVDTYLQKVDRTPTKRVLPLLRATVEQLNSLNTSCNGVLIETDQREDLCAILCRAARNAGVQKKGDLTEPWRDW